MQIRIFPENGIHLTTGRAPQIKSQSVQASDSVFGAQCKVTISKEGRKLSEQSNTQTARSAQSLKTEKMMMRQQEQSEQLDKQSDELKNKYADLLDEISKVVKSTNSSYQSKPDEKTLEKKVQLLHEMGEQKQKQMEENQKLAEYAQNMAMQSSRAQDEIDEKNRDLLIMLKSIEESEKTEEEQENGVKPEETGTKSESSTGDAIQNSAAQFTASSVGRELNVVGMIQALNGEGHSYISRATEIASGAYNEADRIRNILADENYTDAEKTDAVLRYGAKLIGAYDNPATDEPKADAFKELEILLSDDYTDAQKEEALAGYRAKLSSSDLGVYRQRGVQMIRDSKEGKLRHIQDNPLQGMEETKNSMMQSAVDGVFNEATQGKIDEASQELEDAVKELIDKRNDITDADTDKTEEDKEQKEIGELVGTEEDGQAQEA